MLKSVLAPAYALLEHPAGYNFIQWVNSATTGLIRQTFVEHVAPTQSGKVLDLGCGTGNYRTLFRGDYFGIDINPQYILQCAATYEGTFIAMDGTSLAFEDASFDDVVSIATTHHLDDEHLADMIAEALRVTRPGGRVHIIDAVLPSTMLSMLKTAWFRLDRGRHPRKLDHMLAIARSRGQVVQHTVHKGSMHDIVYLHMAHNG